MNIYIYMYCIIHATKIKMKVQCHIEGVYTLKLVIH